MRPALRSEDVTDSQLAEVVERLEHETGLEPATPTLATCFAPVRECLGVYQN